MEKTNQQVVIILHEIYGINAFIENTCQTLQKAGFDVICPNLIGRPPFSYEDSKQAYEHFVTQVGFDVYKEIIEVVKHLKASYQKVFLLGFSVGATIAWRCCEHSLCDGIVGCYGSRIREYPHLNPVCPTLLLFAQEDSFDVDSLRFQLKGKAHLETLTFEAKHGFLDSFSKCFDLHTSKCAENSILRFFSEHG